MLTKFKAYGTQAALSLLLAADIGGTCVILEVAPLRIRAGQAQAFENSFREAQRIISSMPGYVSHELQRCLERTDEYILLVRWESVDAHETGFRGSPQYQEWKALLHHFYDPFPTVLHFEAVPGTTSL